MASKEGQAGDMVADGARVSKLDGKAHRTRVVLEEGAGECVCVCVFELINSMRSDNKPESSPTLWTLSFTLSLHWASSAKPRNKGPCMHIGLTCMHACMHARQYLLRPSSPGPQGWWSGDSIDVLSGILTPQLHNDYSDYRPDQN